MGAMDTILSVDAILTDIAWFLFAGLAVVGLLLGGFKLGQRVRAKEPPAGRSTRSVRSGTPWRSPMAD